MTLLPIVERELRVSARRPKTYWLRLAVAASALILSVWVGVGSSGRTPGVVSNGSALFSGLIVLAFGYCLLVGPFVTADCLSEEKREGTLGLLFLTDLRSYHVVLGKWLATSMAALYGLLALLPSLGLPLLMGGVTPGEYGRAALAVVNAVLFSLTAGMFVSCLSHDQTKAVLGTAVVVLGISGLLPGLAATAATSFFTRPLLHFPAVALASPAYTGYLALASVYPTGKMNYWLSVAIVQAFCWAFMAGTVLVVPRVWRQSRETRPIAYRWLWRFGYTRGWRRRFQRRLRRNPVYALASRLRWPHLVFWVLVALVVINVFWFTYGDRANTAVYQYHVYFSHALVSLNRVWITVMACHFFLEARRGGGLELMLTTPLPVKTLLRGHWRALRQLFFWPIVVIALLHVYFVFGNWRPAMGAAGLGAALRYYGPGAASSLICFLSDVLGLCWLGTWLAVSAKRANLAILHTFALVYLAPRAVDYFAPNLGPQVLQAVLPRGAAHWAYNPLFYYAARALPWVLKNVLFVLWAAYKLHRYFRPAAAQTYRLGHRRVGRWWPLGRSAAAAAGSLVVPEKAMHDA